MMTNNIRRILVGLLVSGACVCVSETAAQPGRGLFVEPRVQTTQLLDDQAVLVGIRAGIARTAGLSVEVGLDLLPRAVARNPGPFFGDEISRLGRLSGALRYNGSLVGPLRYDVGTTLAAGLFSGSFCGGTDACTGGDPGLYLGIGPEVGLGLSLSDRLGLRISGGYAVHQFEPGPEPRGLTIGAGLRIVP